MIRGRNSRATRQGSWLAVFAILLQAVLPALHHPAGMMIASAGGFEAGRNICLAPGSTAPDEPAKAPAHPIPPCAICAAMHAIGGFLPPTAPVITVSRQFDAAAPVAPAALSPRHSPHSRHRPRAPPSLA